NVFGRDGRNAKCEQRGDGDSDCDLRHELLLLRSCYSAPVLCRAQVNNEVILFAAGWCATVATRHKASLSSQRPCEAQLMTIGVRQMEEALAPFGVAWRGVRTIADRQHAGVERVHVGMIKDDAPPPRPAPRG